jgi:hypothetical protein
LKKIHIYMKYISGRDEFLRRSINKVNEFKSLEEKYPSLKEEYKSSDFELILEADSGPFANDIPWGDSLLGRLINSTIRKAKIQANLVRMKGVVSRLERTFNDLLLESKVNDLDENDLAEWAKIRNFTYLYNLEKAVKNMHIEKTPLQEIKNLTNIAIEKTEETADIPKKNELLRQLNEWKKFLDSIKEEDNVTEEDMDPEKKSERISGEKVYLAYVANFQSALRIVNKSILANQQRAAAVMPHLAGNKGFKDGKLTDDEKAELAKRNLQNQGVTTGATSVGITQSTTVPQNSSYEFKWVYSVNESTATASTPVTTNKKPENKISGLIKSLHGMVSQIIPPKEKGSQIEVISDFLKKDINALKNEQYKEPIKKIYTTIAKIVRSGGTQVDPTLENDINSLLARPEDLGKKMADLYMVSKTKEDGKFEGLTKELQDELAIFNTTMKAALYNSLQFSKQGSEPKPEEKKESVIKSYSKFRKIFEADEAVQDKTLDKKEEPEDRSGEVGDRPKSGFITKIQDWWEQKIDLKEWMMDKAEVEKIRINLDKKLAEKKDAVTISSIDPILEICKIFNRAYRIHTTQVIPSGRTGGKVSNKTFMEYTSFGSGTPANAGESGGPYRNNKLFDQWYDAVMDILKEKKYQPIFNVGTRMKVGDEYIDRAGSNLGKFMRDMLEGDEFFTKSKDGGGPQSKFLDKYFGYKDPSNIEKDTAYEGSSEMKEINSVAGNMPKAVEVRFVKDKIPYTDPKELVGTFFAIKNQEQFYKFFYIQKIEGDSAYVLLSSGFGDFKNQFTNIDSSRGKYNGKDGEVTLKPNVVSGTNNSAEEWKIYGAKIPYKLLVTNSGGIGNTSKLSLNAIGLSKNEESGNMEIKEFSEEIIPNEIITLVKFEGETSSGKRYKLSEIGIGRFKGPFNRLLVEMKPEIDKTGLK